MPVCDKSVMKVSLEEKDQKNRAGRAFAKKYEAEKSRENQAVPSSRDGFLCAPEYSGPSLIFPPRISKQTP